MQQMCLLMSLRVFVIVPKRKVYIAINLIIGNSNFKYNSSLLGSHSARYVNFYLFLPVFSVSAAEIYVHVNETTANSEIEYACNSGAETDSILFVILVVDTTSENIFFTSNLLSCPKSQNGSLTIPVFECDREYSIFTYFAYSNGSLSTCRLSSTTTYPQATCPPTTTEPSKSSCRHTV